ncbi:hypothetical protein [Limimaricola cinnabarinus]|uniref:hypothetical protein n=1 Tax=Limimaricola cinnabarinus TaxID=1125964 RepID=UPI002492BC20|nr:hypothetical protein [Limimaricola cinnabarinus]
MKKTGFDRVHRFLNNIADEAELSLDAANRENGEDVLALARVLIPEATGASRLAIRGYQMPDGGYLMDFGPKAKVIEGEKGPRPFVNPALKATRDRRKKRNRKAIKDAIARAKNG